jgi:hypothetical protein
LFSGIQLVHVAPDVERTLQLHDNDCSSSIEQYQAVGKKKAEKIARLAYSANSAAFSPFLGALSD